MSTIAEEFNERLEAFVEKYGLKNATELLATLTSNTKPLYLTGRYKIMSEFLHLETLKTFDLSMDEYNQNRSKSAREARWALVHVLRSFTRLSHRRVGQLLSLSYRASRYAYEKCEELISVGKFEKDFNARYQELEEKLVAFIAKL